MPLYDRIADLPLEIGAYTLEGRSRRINEEFERVTTTTPLEGGGHEGLGEDVTYDPDQQRSQQDRGPALPLAGDWTFGSFCDHVGTLYPSRAQQASSAAFPYYTRAADA